MGSGVHLGRKCKRGRGMSSIDITKEVEVYRAGKTAKTRSRMSGQ